MIEIKNVTKTYNYKKSNAFTALHDVSLTVENGEMISIIGKSGAGKSTLLHIIACIDGFEAGSYRLDGVEIDKLSDKAVSRLRNEKIGIVMQDFALIDDYSVLDNVKIPLAFSKKNIPDATRLALSALAKVGMKDLYKKPVSKLSGGQKQRVAIARAIVNDPDYILADEPTGALDSKTALEIMGMLKALNKLGKTIIIITHDANVAKACHRIVHISDGSLTEAESTT